METSPRVVIVGGGFGGLRAAQRLRRTPVQVLLLDRRNFHLFQPLLYQVATGWLSPANIASPLRRVFKRQKNVQVWLAEVADIDAIRQRVHLSDGTLLSYDTLIIAAGSRHHYFGHPAWEQHAPGLKTVEDATELRRRILLAFEAAEREVDSAQVRRWLTFVIVGGGPTGVEMAGALAELARDALKHDFRRINPADAQIMIIEGCDDILQSYPDSLVAKAAAELERLGVTLYTGSRVTEIRPEAVTVQRGAQTLCIPTHTVIWAAGVQASPLGHKLAASTGAQVDQTGRIMVEPDLSIPGHPNIFVIGDMAHYSHQTGTPLPGIAPVAQQQGEYVARCIIQRLRGATLPPFHYRDRGRMAIVGRAVAVADLGRVHVNGFVAWLAWLWIHLVSLIEFENRLLVLIQWAGNYVSRNRAARLITGVDSMTLPVSHGAVHTIDGASSGRDSPVQSRPTVARASGDGKG